MTGSIGSGGTLPPFNATTIEQRVKREFETLSVDKPALEARRDELQATRDSLLQEHRDAGKRADGWKDARYVGGSALGVGALGAGAGALLGGAGNRLMGAGGGALGGVALGMFAGLGSLWFQSFVDSSFGLDPSRAQKHYGSPDTPEFRELSRELGDVEQQLDALPNADMIEPGAAWLQMPNGAEMLRGRDDVQVGAWASEIVASHDHDGDGAIRIDDDSRTARNELLRSRAGGPFTGGAVDEATIARVRELPIAEQRLFDANADGSVSSDEIRRGAREPLTTEHFFGLITPQLERYDTDRSGSVTREELAEGITRDAATNDHGMYNYTFDDGTVLGSRNPPSGERATVRYGYLDR